MTEEMNQIDVQVPEVGDVVKGIVTKVEDKHVDVDIPNCKQTGIIPLCRILKRRELIQFFKYLF